MCILDLSKTLTYDFRYNYVKKKFDDKAKLLFTDTDSLTYEIETEDVYQNFGMIRINLTIVTILIILHILIKQKKVIGEIKEEASSKAITHFVALRSKMYSYKTDNKKIDRTA